MHILPDLEALEETFENNEQVLVIGVHSAKFENERVGSNISNAIQRYDIKHPVINDAQATLWHNLSIRLLKFKNLVKILKRCSISYGVDYISHQNI